MAKKLKIRNILLHNENIKALYENRPKVSNGLRTCLEVYVSQFEKRTNFDLLDS